MKPSSERGFTLIEVVVAMMLLTVGLVSMAEMLAVTLRMQQLGRNETSAARVAQDKLDQLMSLDWNAEPTIQIGGSLTADVANYNDTDVQGYKRRWAVIAGPDASADLRQITIRVIPDVADRRTVSPYELVTVIRRW